MAAIHGIHKVIKHFDHVGLCGGGALLHVGVIAGDGLEGDQNVGVIVVRAVFHDRIEGH